MSTRAVRAVLEDSKAKGRHRLLLVVLAEHLNEKTRQCNPGIETLARECNCDVRDIRRQLDDLADAGEIVIARGGGRNRCNSYTITAAENRGTDAPQSAQINAGTRAPVSCVNGGTGARKQGHGYPPNQNNHKNVSERESGFAEFWEAYPRKTAKRRALKAWCASHKDRPPLATMLAILAKHVAGWNDPTFIPHPATWLNGHRWEDELKTPVLAAGRRSSL